MALQGSGPISIANINVELNQTASQTTSLNDSNARTLAGVASGAISMSSFYGKSSIPPFADFTTPGTYSWICPPGVTSISIVAVSAGSGGWGSEQGQGCINPSTPGYGGNGGGLGYANNITVVPGTIYTVVVGLGGRRYWDVVYYNVHYDCWNCTGPACIPNSYVTSFVRDGGDSKITIGGVEYGAKGAKTQDLNPSTGPGKPLPGSTGGKGGLGGAGTNRYIGYTVINNGGGGGAGGYAGDGGQGGSVYNIACWCACWGAYPNIQIGYNAAPGSGGGSGGGSVQGSGYAFSAGYPGGGVGIYGLGTTGTNANAGGPGTNVGVDGSGGHYGWGAAGYTLQGNAGGGALRIVWPGTTRQYPSTNVNT